MQQQPYQSPYSPPLSQGYVPPPVGDVPYAPPGAQYVNEPATKDLDDQSLIWLIVACAGFFFGLGFVTGPLAWIFGARLRHAYRTRGREPEGTATAAWIVGIVSTAIFGLVLMFVLFLFMFVFAAVGVAASGI